MAGPRGYRSFADFERTEIRPGMRAGWCADDLETSEVDQEFDADPFEAMLNAASDEVDDDDDEDDDE